MQQFFADRPAEGGRVILTGEEHRHATRSCRVRIGEVIAIGDGRGWRVRAHIVAIDATELIAEVEENLSGQGEPVLAVTLALSAITPARFEQAVEECTELGVRRIQPLIAERCETGVVQRLKSDRIVRIIREAAKQAKRSWTPELAPVLKPGALTPPSNGLLLVAAQEKSRPLVECGDLIRNAGEVIIAIGPEGDFTPDEYCALAAAGAIPVGLGGLTLRSETAAVAAVSMVCGFAGADRGRGQR